MKKYKKFVALLLIKIINELFLEDTRVILSSSASKTSVIRTYDATTYYSNSEACIEEVMNILIGDVKNDGLIIVESVESKENNPQGEHIFVNLSTELEIIKKEL